MMKKEHIERIELYLAGEVSISELRDYAKSQNIDNLDEEIEWVKNVGLAVEANELRDHLSDILPTVQKTEAKVKSLASFKWIAGIAASLLLLVVAYTGLQKSNSDSYQYAQYEYQDPGLPIKMSQSDDYALYDALSYFGEENYKTTIEKLNAIEGITSDTINYYLGASYYYNNELENSITQLKLVDEIKTSRFHDQAQWLLSLSYLKDKNISAAKAKVIAILENPNHTFYSQAKKLDQELNN